MGKDIFSFVDFYVESKSTNDFRSFLAVFIAIFALVLSFITIESDLYKQNLHSQEVLINDTWNFYQAKNIRQTSYKLSLDILELELRKNQKPELRNFLDEKIAFYKNTIERYETEENEGKLDLFKKAKELETGKEHLIIDLRYLSYAQITATISIVLSCVALIRNGKLGYALFGVSLGLIFLSVLILIVIIL